MPMTLPIRLAMIYGSNREGRLCDTVADWAAAEVDKSGAFSLLRLDPAGLDLSLRHPGRDDPTVAGLRRAIATADAFLVVTPEYNRGYPAPLKFMIDCASHEWHAKPVAFVSYGGISGGLRAVEQLRLVFGELHTATIRDCVSFAQAHERFRPDGSLPEGDGAYKAMAVLLARLAWWARALREARQASAYGEIAA